MGYDISREDSNDNSDMKYLDAIVSLGVLVDFL